jgi:predicted DNA-binding transcriptional regulator AlpA
MTPPKNPLLDDTLCAEEIAELRHVDVKTIHSYHARDGQMPPAHWQKGRTPLWWKPEIEEWIAQSKKPKAKAKA